MATAPLPGPDELAGEIQAMVDLGPRLTGTVAHDRFCSWLEAELEAAGLELLAPDRYPYERWHAQRLGLEVLDGAGPVPVASAYVRSASTPEGGLTGPLVDAGEMTLRGAAGDAGALDEFKRSLARRAVSGAVVLLRLPVPQRLTGEGFVQVARYLHWPGHGVDDWAGVDYRRPWVGPWPELEVFAELGVAGVVVSVDASREVVAGNYSPHTGRPQPVPGVVVDRATGEDLAVRARQRPPARLTLVASREQVTIRSVTGVLPGRGDELLVVNSHSDGQNAFEENGSVALVALARHFASLPPGERLDRTLVFASWPGHMSGVGGLEDASGWIAAHRDLCARAAGAVTVEHLGASEWVEGPDGYQATGEPEPYALWATEGPFAEEAQTALVEADLPRHGVLRPPVQITPGAPFHHHGVPHVSGIAGPTYLLVVSSSGEMEKLDAPLATRQVAFYADLLRRLDRVPASAARAKDPTLGTAGPYDGPVPT